MEREFRKNNNIVIAVYSHPEFYPPTLNAIGQLAKQFDNVYVISRNVLISEWDYPSNVKLIKTGNFISIRQSEKKNIIYKTISFLSFTLNLYKLIILKRPCLIHICDNIPLFSVFLIHKLISKEIKLWYHNHDVADLSLNRNFSIGWFASKYEDFMFPKIDIFTLPSTERERYFPINLLKGNYYFLPNYPAKHFYNKFVNSNKHLEHEIKLIYQGSIGPGHGLEEIISILGVKIRDKIVTLHLKGFISENYKLELIKCAELNLVKKQLFFYPVTAYQDVPKLASTCHIGIAIHTGTDIMNSTLGTSSNKIYEYAALGLPVLLYDNKHFRDTLSQYNWASFSNLEKENLINCILIIDENYKIKSKMAIDTFQNSLNFEKYFEIIKLKEIE